MRTVQLVVRRFETVRLHRGVEGVGALVLMDDRRVVLLLEHVEERLPVRGDLRPEGEALGHEVERIAVDAR